MRACVRRAGWPSARQACSSGSLHRVPSKPSSADALRHAQAGSAQRWGVILGTLGRQGNPRVFDHLCQVLQEQQKPHVQVCRPEHGCPTVCSWDALLTSSCAMQVLLSEVLPHKVAAMQEVDAWVQVGPLLLPCCCLADDSMHRRLLLCCAGGLPQAVHRLG